MRGGSRGTGGYFCLSWGGVCAACQGGSGEPEGLKCIVMDKNLPTPGLHRGAKEAPPGRAPLCSFPLAAGQMLGWGSRRQQDRLGCALRGSSPTT